MSEEIITKENGRRRHFSPELKFQIFLESARGDISITEVLRKHGIHSTDLKRIRDTVREAALKELAHRKSRKKNLTVSEEEYLALKAERDRLQDTVVEQSVELALLKKKVNLE
jgi:transposase-like protein